MHTPDPKLAFIGGGNMASAIIGGLIRQGTPAANITVVEPLAETAQQLRQQWGLRVLSQPGPELQAAHCVVWAVKPQIFREAAATVAPHVRAAMHLSVAAGIRTDSICGWLGSERLVRGMPNTPALVGQGMTALFACAAISDVEKQLIEQIVATTGAFLWVEKESQLDAVTALSGSGPAYVFYFLEAMTEAGARLGLSRQQAYRLAVATFSGAASLAAASPESPQVLRERVTSKGGTTHAAITAMDKAQVKEAFIEAMQAACTRASELGDEFGKP